MDKFIIVFLSMLVTLTLATYLTSDKTTNESDIVLNFKDEKIKCKCNIDDIPERIKEDFTNYTKDLIIDKPPINENIITSIGNLNKPKHTNITAKDFYEKHFTYPLEPIVINKYEVFPVNEYKYLNIGQDTDKIM